MVLIVLISLNTLTICPKPFLVMSLPSFLPGHERGITTGRGPRHEIFYAVIPQGRQALECRLKWCNLHFITV
jgi:hypothetical protein